MVWLDPHERGIPEVRQEVTKWWISVFEAGGIILREISGSAFLHQ